MVPKNSKTIFSRIHSFQSINTETEKLSYWLEKLHIQGEKVRKDNNRREEQSINVKKEQSLPEQMSNTKIQDPIQSGIKKTKKI